MIKVLLITNMSQIAQSFITIIKKSIFCNFEETCNVLRPKLKSNQTTSKCKAWYISFLPEGEKFWFFFVFVIFVAPKTSGMTSFLHKKWISIVDILYDPYYCMYKLVFFPEKSWGGEIFSSDIHTFFFCFIHHDWPSNFTSFPSWHRNVRIFY